jgi:hypothetical protein
MDELERLLEDVAQEVSQKVSEDDTFSTGTLAAVLRHRLLPLLRAGQAAKNEMCYQCCEVDGSGSGNHLHYCKAWDAALQAALGAEGSKKSLE